MFHAYLELLYLIDLGIKLIQTDNEEDHETELSQLANSKMITLEYKSHHVGIRSF